MTQVYLSDTLFRRRYSEYAHRSEPVFLQMPVNVDDRMIIMEYSKSTSILLYLTKSLTGRDARPVHT